jgi:hypothetical protein
MTMFKFKDKELVRIDTKKAPQEIVERILRRFPLGVFRVKRLGPNSSGRITYLPIKPEKENTLFILYENEIISIEKEK